jgi:DNA helicase-2/ATP-dependent DNA helicase PcrA
MLYGGRLYNLPSRFLDEPPDADARAAPGPPLVEPGTSVKSQIPTVENVPSLSTGDSVKHGTLGEGVVLRMEAGGVVVVRFADDGSERC